MSAPFQSAAKTARTHDGPTPSATSARSPQSRAAPNATGPDGAPHYAGNLAIQRLLKARPIQASLTVNDPDDAHEREADRIARQITSTPAQFSAGDVRQMRPLAETIT